MRRTWNQEAGPIWSLDEGGAGFEMIDYEYQQTGSMSYVRQRDYLYQLLYLIVYMNL